MREFGTTQRQLAAVASKNHAHSVKNPLSQYQKEFSVEEVLAAAPITFPLTLPMCSPISDGSAAAIVCSSAGLKKMRGDAKRKVGVLASVLQSGSVRKAEDLENHVSKKGAKKAYELAAIGPQDVDVAEVHDATAMGEVLEVEALGFCPVGDGLSLIHI